MKKRNTKTEISIIGLDLAKTVFQLHGIDESGEVVLTKQLRRIKVFCTIKALPHWHGSLWRITLLVKGIKSARAHGTHDGPRFRQALPEEQQK